MEFVKLTTEDIPEMKILFRAVFTAEPWNDDWSDDKQLENYLLDLTGNRNSLSLAMRDESGLVALALGHIKHWYSATEYYIDELCVRTEMQNRGIGGQFLADIEKYLKANDVRSIFLLTNRNYPAYKFYRKNGFEEYRDNVAFGKNL